MSKYTAEQIESLASEILNAPATSMIGSHISLETPKAAAIYNVLCNYAELLREREQKEVMKVEASDDGHGLSAVTGGAHRNNAHVVEKVAKAIAPCPWDELDRFEKAAYTLRAVMAIDAYEATKEQSNG